MKQFWIDVERLSTTSILNLGIGITAFSDEDAREIFAEPFPYNVIAGVRQVLDMRTIEQNHVAPNIDPLWMQRGIWFPQGVR